MARRRFIHPDFFIDEYLVTLPPFTRLLFAGLWCLSDREGRLPDKPVKIKMQLFPADQVDVDAALDALAAGGLVTRYVVDGEKFIQVNRFGKHQHPHPKEAPSVIPPMGASETTPRCVPDNTQVLPTTHLGVVEQGGYSGSSDTQDLRSVGVPADAPKVRPAAPRPEPPMRDEMLQPPCARKPLAYKPRIDMAWPGRPPVPSALHAEFITKLGGDPEEARTRLLAWYPQAAAPYEDQAIGDDDFAFWRHRFREWVGTTRQMGRSRASPVPTGYDEWCHHEPRCASREWHAMRLTREENLAEAAYR
jgi:hypothetical protein